MDTINSISVNELYSLIATPDYPIIIDVRTQEDFDDDPRIIPAAVRVPFAEITEFTNIYNDKKVVIYCQKGLKISQGAMAILRVANKKINCKYLTGGQFAWRDANLPMVNANKIAFNYNSNSNSNSLWVCSERPQVDCIACVWLIRRFIDANAKFLFVESSQVINVADRFNATPFAVNSAKFGKKDDLCSFEVFIKEFSLISPALIKIASIIKGASCNNFDISESSALFATSFGLANMFSDDLEQIDANMIIYDAYYNWASAIKSD